MSHVEKSDHANFNQGRLLVPGGGRDIISSGHNSGSGAGNLSFSSSILLGAYPSVLGGQLKKGGHTRARAGQATRKTDRSASKGGTKMKFLSDNACVAAWSAFCGVVALAATAGTAGIVVALLMLSLLVATLVFRYAKT